MPLYMDIQQVISKYYNPKDRLSEQLWRMYKDPRVREKATWGIVEDNKDPDGYGRLKVRAPLVFADATTPWIPMLRPWASKEFGVWTLPDIGDAVIICFSMCDPSKPFVIGCIHTKRTLPFLEKNPENDQKYIRTKSGLEVVMNDKDGEEQLIVSAKDGKMLFLMDSNGIQITNELGDIKVKARKVTFESENVLLKSSKDTSIKASDGPLEMTSSKAFVQKASGNLKVKGKKVKLKGQAGVTAGMKQIAKKDDMVVGVDLHDIQVPTNSGLTTVPAIPHPYTGKLVDKLSDDVTINDKPAAVKGSKSKNNPSHICMPPGVKFAANPNNEGEVSSGTEPSVKVNDKEVAVLGSMVKTCNDPQPQETCSIIAVGASVALPIMPPGFDPEQYKRDGGFVVNMRDPVAQPGQPNSMTDERSLSDAKWNGSTAKTGQEVTLSVKAQSQQGFRGAVIFKIYPEGADPQNSAPLKTISAKVENDKAEAKIKFGKHDQFFPSKADPLLMEQMRQIMGRSISPQLLKHYISDISVPKAGDKTETNKYFFTAWAFRCDIQTSDLIEIGSSISIKVQDSYGIPLANREITISDPVDSESSASLGAEGEHQKDALIGGVYHVKIKKE